MKRPFSYRNRQRIAEPEPGADFLGVPTEEPEPWDEEEDEDAPEAPIVAPVAAEPPKKRKRKLRDWTLQPPTPASALALQRWYSGAPSKEVSQAAALLSRRRKRFRSNYAVTCTCGTCLTCYNRQKQRESRARRKQA